MVDAEILMRQGGYTAREWFLQAKDCVKDMNMSDDAKARIIAAFMLSAAQDQHTMTMRGIAEDMSIILGRLR